MTFCRFRSRAAAVCLFLTFAVPLASAVSAEPGGGTIKGRIIVSSTDDVTSELMRERSLNRYETAGAAMDRTTEPYTLSEKAVVYVESAEGEFAPPKLHPSLDQRGMLFRPLVLPIVVGTTVDFPNSDPLFHNVFSLSQAKEFDLGRYPKGQKKSVTFDRTGIVSVFCEIHSYMFATILVLQNPYFAVPDVDGSYTIAGVPPGTYHLDFIYGRKNVRTKTVVVNRDETTTADFSY